MELKTNKSLLATLMLGALTLAGCGSDSGGNQSGSAEPNPPVTAARDSDRDGVADTEDAKPFDAEVSARSVSEYFDDDGNLIGTGTYEIRADGKITAQDNVYLAGGDLTSFRAEITYTDSGEVASIVIDDELDGSVDFTTTYTYNQADQLILKVSSGSDSFRLSSDELNDQLQPFRVYQGFPIAGTPLLRRSGTAKLTYNASGSLTSEQVDYGSDGSVEYSVSLVYDSADRLISLNNLERDAATANNSQTERAFLYEGSNVTPVSDLLVDADGVRQVDFTLDAQGQVISGSASFALRGSDEVSADQIASDTAGSTLFTQRQLKNSYASAFAGLSGANSYFDLLYRSTYLTGLSGSGTLVLQPSFEFTRSYDQNGNTTNLIKSTRFDDWEVQTFNAQGQITSIGFDDDLDGQADRFSELYNYNSQGYLTRLQLAPAQFSESQYIPERLTQIFYRGFGPTAGSLFLEGSFESTADFSVTYDNQGFVRTYDLNPGPLLNLSFFAALSHQYEGRSQIDPVQLNRYIFGLSEEPDFTKLINLSLPLIDIPVIDVPVIDEPVIVKPDLPQVPVGGCPGGLSFC